jgi:hypothetical protein
MGIRMLDHVGGCPRHADLRGMLFEAGRSESGAVGVGWGKDWGKRSRSDVSSGKGATMEVISRRWLPQTISTKYSSNIT